MQFGPAPRGFSSLARLQYPGRAPSLHVLAIWLFVVCLASACQRESRPPPNVLLVTIDTLRADHLAFHGYYRKTMPLLSEWLAETTIFENCFSPLPLTDPSMSSLLTGLYPIRHGVRHNARKLDPAFTTLAQVLRASGYETAAFTSRDGLIGEIGLERGFDHANYEGGGAMEGMPPGGKRNAEKWQRRAEHVTEAALAWLGMPREKPFFVWLHYFDPHAHYDPPERFAHTFTPGLPTDPVRNLRAWWGRVSDRNQTIAAYDAEIVTVDHHLAKVVEHLRAIGEWNDTLFVLTADHGESLGEHGHMDHGEWLYQEQIHIPLLMRLPGTVPAGQRVPGLVRSIDIAPSIIELAGVSGAESDRFVKQMDGQSLVPMLRGKEGAPRRIFVESKNCPETPEAAWLAPGMECHPGGVAGKLRAVYDGRWKLIITPLEEGRKYELYNLEADPAETDDLSAKQPDRVAALEREIDRFWETATPRAVVDDEMVERLRALGYAD